MQAAAAGIPSAPQNLPPQSKGKATTQSPWAITALAGGILLLLGGSIALYMGLAPGASVNVAMRLGFQIGGGLALAGGVALIAAGALLLDQMPTENPPPPPAKPPVEEPQLLAIEPTPTGKADYAPAKKPIDGLKQAASKIDLVIPPKKEQPKRDLSTVEPSIVGGQIVRKKWEIPSKPLDRPYFDDTHEVLREKFRLFHTHAYAINSYKRIIKEYQEVLKVYRDFRKQISGMQGSCISGIKDHPLFQNSAFPKIPKVHEFRSTQDIANALVMLSQQTSQLNEEVLHFLSYVCEQLPHMKDDKRVLIEIPSAFTKAIEVLNSEFLKKELVEAYLVEEDKKLFRQKALTERKIKQVREGAKEIEAQIEANKRSIRIEIDKSSFATAVKEEMEEKFFKEVKELHETWLQNIFKGLEESEQDLSIALSDKEAAQALKVIYTSVQDLDREMKKFMGKLRIRIEIEGNK
jgi:hypothetical protein